MQVWEKGNSEIHNSSISADLLKLASAGAFTHDWRSPPEHDDCSGEGWQCPMKSMQLMAFGCFLSSTLSSIGKLIWTNKQRKTDKIVGGG
ncbi:hypothetical protein Nepgr_025686 [Nepenthes gracilis]|uniref:Uncharacterized protein n=1 Tax=Nepenthes gracilis TaxID=150966 RepID=A0AAD3T6S9_NEPGR|nr:hypothetical protein Nepgr_025686 [Nepenthes gracilis]